MIQKEEFQRGIANILKRYRIKRCLSKKKMADLLYLDERTWSRYEDGTSSPTSAELLWMFSQLNENVLPDILRLIYPGTYGDLTINSSTQELREAASHYMLNVASERTVREWSFLVFGKHGSNIVPQLQMFTMIAHLPMQYRVAIAQQVRTLWRLAEARGELINTDHIMPDIAAFEDGLAKGEKAAFAKENSYTTALSTEE